MNDYLYIIYIIIFIDYTIYNLYRLCKLFNYLYNNKNTTIIIIFVTCYIIIFLNYINII